MFSAVCLESLLILWKHRIVDQYANSQFEFCHCLTFFVVEPVACDCRNYLEHVAGTIVEWTQQEEAKYQAKLLAAEVEEIHHVGKGKPEDGSEKKKKGAESAKSPKPNTR